MIGRRFMNEATRRQFIKRIGRSAIAASAAAFPTGCGMNQTLTLDFLTIPDPDGWHPLLRLKGDWVIFKISDGTHSGCGEASHSKDDQQCRRIARDLFDSHLSGFSLSMANLQKLEDDLRDTDPDFVAATAWSGLNQALYELLAKREGVPVWRLFTDRPGFDRLPLYATINRAIRNRSVEEYLKIVGEVQSQGFKIFKCAPFEKVNGPQNAIENSREGLDLLKTLREHFPRLGIRVDFHERYTPADFHQLIPEFEKLRLDWIEEPFKVGPEYAELKKRTRLRVSGGELFWGSRVFREFIERQWVDVIMPDVKHVGGFGPLLSVLEMGKGKIEVSPHNPSGPVSTAASLHAAAIHPRGVRSLEFAFDRAQNRRKYGEAIQEGFLQLSRKPGWGIEVEPAA